MFGSFVSLLPLAGVSAMIAACHVFGRRPAQRKVETLDFYGELKSGL